MTLTRLAELRREGRTLLQIANISGVSLEKLRDMIQSCISAGLLSSEDERRRSLVARSIAKPLRYGAASRNLLDNE